MNSGIYKNAQPYSGIPTKARRKKICCQSQIKPSSSSKMTRDGFGNIRMRKTFPTDYSGLIGRLPANLPSSLLRGITGSNEPSFKKKENPGPGKVKIMLRVSSDATLTQSTSQEFLRADESKKHVSVFVPSHPEKRNNALAPKVYSFDSVFTEKSSLEEISAASLIDVIQAVLQGADGAVFCYGQSDLGKTFVLFGKDSSVQNIGIVPNAINWLYRSINELRDHQKIRLFVRVSAVEVYGRSEKLKDLLVGFCEDAPASKICINEDPLLGTQLQNVCETSANTAEKAAYLLDAALSSRSCNRQKSTSDARRHSHMFYTLHIYQHKVERNEEGGVSGGRSRLHFIDLGSCEKTLVKTTNSLALSYSSLGHVIMSIVNNSKHVPFKESKLTRVLREHLGNINCRAVMLAHVSRDVTHYSDTLSTIQIASRIHRVLKKRTKILHDGQSKLSNSRFQRSRLLKHRDDESIGSSSGLEFTSGSELSCDTVVYVNKNGVAMSDLEFTDNEGPPQNNAEDERVATSATKTIVSNEMIYNIAQAKIQKPRPGIILYQEKSNQSRPIASTAMKYARPKANIASTYKHPKPKLPIDTISNRILHTSEECESNHPQKLQRSKLTKVAKSNPIQTFKSTNLNLKSANNKTFKSSFIPTSSIQKVAKKNHQKAFESISFKDNEVSETFSIQDNIFNHTTASATPVKPPRQHQTSAKMNFVKQTKIPKTSSKQTKLTQSSRSSSSSSRKLKTNDEENQSELRKHSACNESFCKKTNSRENEKSKLFQGINDSPETNQVVFLRDCLQQSPNHSGKFLPEMERPEPVGCAFETEPISNMNNSFVDSTYCDLSYLPKHENRLDSMGVNVDGEDAFLQDIDDKDGVDVNFYCLTFTTRNPLIPMSKQKFTQQIRNNIKRKSLVEVTKSDKAECGPRTEMEDVKTDKLKNNCDKSASETESEINPIGCQTRHLDNQFESSCSCLNHGTLSKHSKSCCDDLMGKFYNVEELVVSEKTEVAQQIKSIADEEDDFTEEQELKEMPKLACEYASNPDSGNKAEVYGTLSSKYSQGSIRSFYNSPHHEVCLYDSNSLAISYVSTKHNLSSSSESASRSSTSSPCNSKRDDLYRSSDAVQRSGAPVVVTKSTSKEGARLTLVKKPKRGGSTLELLITDENASNNNEMLPTADSEQTKRSSRFKITKRSRFSKPESKSIALPTCSQSSQKKSKWSGLKRFGAKKNAKPLSNNAEIQKSKTNLVSKLLPGKSKTNSNDGKPKEKLKPQCTNSRNQKQSSNKQCSASTSLSRTNLRVSQSLSHAANRNREFRRSNDATGPCSTQKERLSAPGASPSQYGFTRKSKFK